MIRKYEKKCSVGKMKFSVLGACSGLGQKKMGLDLTPDLIRAHGFLDILKTSKSEFVDLGNIKSNTAGEIWSFLNQVKKAASENISDDKILFNLGGDHSIALGTISGTLDKFADARVVWIDAHGDLNTPASSFTGNIHGMPLAALLGLFKTELDIVKLKKENLILVGVRDLDEFESDLIKDLKIDIITAAEINNNPKTATDKFGVWLNKKSTPIHVSFDIDAVDPTVAPATGLPVAGGLSKAFTENLIRQIAITKNVIAVDLVELNAWQAVSESEIESTMEIFLSVLKIFIDSNQSLETTL